MVGVVGALSLLPARSALASAMYTQAPPPQRNVCSESDPPGLSVADVADYCLAELAETEAAMDLIFFKGEAATEEDMIELQRLMSKRQTALQMMRNLGQALRYAEGEPPSPDGCDEEMSRAPRVSPPKPESLFRDIGL